MKNNSTLRFWLLNVFLVLFSFNGFGQILIPNTTPLTENFDAMGTSTGAVIPTNWKLHQSASPTWAGGTSSVGQAFHSGTPTTGAAYNWGTSTTERSLGVMTSGGYASPNSIMAFYQNSNASAITDITISYDLERYRSNTAAASVQFYYSLNGTAWTAVTAGDIAAASLPTGASAYSFTPGLTINVAAFTITGLSITNGSNIYLRWNLNTTGGNSQGIGIDNVSVTAAFGVASPTITASPSSLSSFTYIVGSGPSAVQTFTTSGSNLTNDIVLTAPANFEISTASAGPFSSTLTLTQTGGTVAATPIFTRLISALGVNTYTGNLSLTSTGASSLTVTLNGSVTASAATDIISAGGESATISSLINTNGPLTSVQGTQVWQFTIRDGGAGLNDADNLPSILTALTFSQAAGDAIGDWSQTIQAIDLFDGATNVGSGTVTTNQVQFTGLNISVADNTSKTISVRLTLKCPVGAGALDGDDFGFQISNGNVVFSPAGSGKTSFSATVSTNGKNAVDIVATKLVFVQEPSTTNKNGVMIPSPTVSATDACGNIDRDFTGNILITSTGTLNTSPITVAAVNGTAAFNSVIHTVAATSLTLLANATGLTSATSAAFNINNMTVFQPGDIAILAFNTDVGGGTDEISFVSFIDITPGATLDITDNAYEKCGTPNGWGIAEGWVRLVRTTSTLPAGKIITIRVTSGSATVIAPDANWTCSKPQPAGQGTFDMNANGEQIFFMANGAVGGPGTSTANSDAGTYSGNFLYGFNTKGNIWAPVCANAAGGGTQNSAKPVNFDCYLVWPTAQADKNKYTGPLTDTTQRQWIDRIGNPTNWTGYANNTAYNAGPDYVDYNGTNLGRDIVVLTGGGSFIDGIWVGAKSTDWFECSNWQSMRLPISTTDVLIDQLALRNCEVGISTFTTNAVCNTVTLNSNNATARNLSVINGASLTVGSNVTINKTLVSAPLSLSVLNTATFTCNNLTLTGTGNGIEDAQFNNKQNTTTVNINGNLTLNTGAKLDLTDVANYGIVNLAGSYFNNGLESDFKQTNSIVKFNGTAVQSITTNGFNEVFGNIIVNKPSGTLNLYNNVEVENVVTYTLGLINSTASALLIYRDGATHNSVSNSSFTNGPVRKIGNDAFTFPIGKTSVYAPAGITAPGVVTDHFTAEYFDANPHPTYNNTLKDATIDHLSICEYWMINRTNGASNVSVNLSWDTPRSCGVTALPDMLVARWDGTMWKNHGNGATTGNTAAGSVTTAAPITAFSPFTLASVSVLNPLPVKWLSFEAQKNIEFVDLIWNTTAEFKNNYFDIMHSADGINFEKIGQVNAGASYSLVTKNYKFIDKNPLKGENYYQLNQVDFNGKTTKSEIRKIDFDLASELLVYPNPVEAGSTIEIVTNNYLNEEKIEIAITNQIGKEVFQKTYNAEKTIKINTQNLAKGVYYINIKMQNKIISQRLIII